MKLLLLAFGLFVLGFAFTEANIPCSSCTGPYVEGIDGHECVTVIKQKCTGMSGRTTSSWTRGVRVLDNCNTIPLGTAIATFFGAGNTYNSGSYKHAAIFKGCETEGIRVHDQWNTSGGCPPASAGLAGRVLRRGESSSNGAETMYTIV